MPAQTYRSPLQLALTVAVSALLLLSTALRAQDAASMALPERRALKQYQDTKFVEEQKSLRAAAGFDVPLEVKWETIARAGEAQSFLLDTYWTNIYFTPLVAALKQIAADPAGAEALKGKLKKIIVSYDKVTAPLTNYANGLSFEGGVPDDQLRAEHQLGRHHGAHQGDGVGAGSQALRTLALRTFRAAACPASAKTPSAR